ncbi:hypothetical protein SFR_4368 [Streptomyces sp. FR-008]|nr:hypothetical protein SFR_4368 [Streptomyces sp. FR-008]
MFPKAITHPGGRLRAWSGRGPCALLTCGYGDHRCAVR